MKTTSPLLNADFNAVDPKVVHRDDRFWYVVPPRPQGQDGSYYQESPEKMVMCYLCSKDKFEGNSYDTKMNSMLELAPIALQIFAVRTTS